LIREPPMGVPISVATAVVVKNAPSLAPILFLGVIWLTAVGVIEIKVPEQKPWRHVKATRVPISCARSYMAKQNRPEHAVMGYSMLRYPI